MAACLPQMRLVEQSPPVRRYPGHPRVWGAPIERVPEARVLTLALGPVSVKATVEGHSEEGASSTFPQSRVWQAAHVEEA